MPKHKIVANPTAGGGTAEGRIPEIERMLGGHGLEFDIDCTTEPWHAAALARKAVEDAYDVIVAVGGDGTANEVLNGVMQARRDSGASSAVGVLPVGTGNDFAYGVRVPSDVAEGCRALAEGHRRKIDVGRVTGGHYPEGRYFGNGVGIGFDAAAGFEAAKLTRLRGFIRYLVAALRTIFLYYKAPKVLIEYGDQSITQSALQVAVMNGQRVGGGFMMAPDAIADDGQFDLCIARQVSQLRILALLPHFIKGSQATQEPVSTARAAHVVVTALEGALPAHADGETLCYEGERLEMELLPQAVEVVCGAPEGGE